MYKNLPEILQFCGLDRLPIATFPKFRPRKTNWEKMCTLQQKVQLDKLYGDLYGYAASLPDIQKMPVI